MGSSCTRRTSEGLRPSTGLETAGKTRIQPHPLTCDNKCRQPGPSNVGTNPDPRCGRAKKAQTRGGWEGGRSQGWPRGAYGGAMPPSSGSSWVPDGFGSCRFKADRTHWTIFCRKAGMQLPEARQTRALRRGGRGIYEFKPGSVGSWVSGSTSLSLHFSTCKMGHWLRPPHRVVRRSSLLLPLSK